MVRGGGAVAQSEAVMFEDFKSTILYSKEIKENVEVSITLLTLQSTLSTWMAEIFQNISDKLNGIWKKDNPSSTTHDW